MRIGHGYRRIAPVLFPLIIFGALVLAGIVKTVLVVEIGSADVVLPVSDGDTVVHSYTNSMYEAAVREKFRIEDGRLKLVHVTTESDAVLSYLGIEGKAEPNVEGTFNEFTIPAASVGNHSIEVRAVNVPLGTHEGRDGRVRVRVLRVPLLEYVALRVRS